MNVACSEITILFGTGHLYTFNVYHVDKLQRDCRLIRNEILKVDPIGIH